MKNILALLLVVLSLTLSTNTVSAQTATNTVTNAVSLNLDNGDLAFGNADLIYSNIMDNVGYINAEVYFVTNSSGSGKQYIDRQTVSYDPNKRGDLIAYTKEGLSVLASFAFPIAVTNASTNGPYLQFGVDWAWFGKDATFLEQGVSQYFDFGPHPQQGQPDVVPASITNKVSAFPYYCPLFSTNTLNWAKVITPDRIYDSTVYADTDSGVYLAGHGIDDAITNTILLFSPIATNSTATGSLIVSMAIDGSSSLSYPYIKIQTNQTLLKFALGTGLRQQVKALSQSITLDNTSMSLSFSGEPGLSIRVFQSQDFLSWQLLTTNKMVLGTNGIFKIPIVPTTTHNFFKATYY